MFDEIWHVDVDVDVVMFAFLIYTLSTRLALFALQFILYYILRENL